MFPCEIILVPHVCPPDEGIDDDYSYLNELYRSLPETLRSRVRLLPRGLGFIATKTELIKCDLCIAARMHCAINAMTAYVPTVLLSYSSKAFCLLKALSPACAARLAALVFVLSQASSRRTRPCVMLLRDFLSASLSVLCGGISIVEFLPSSSFFCPRISGVEKSSTQTR